MVYANNVSDAQLDGFRIYNSGSDHNYHGIKLWACSNILISNNLFTNNTNGIYLWGSSSVFIRNNIVQDNGNSENIYVDYGIICLESTPLITNNLVIENLETGIYLAWIESSGAQVINNTIVGNGYEGVWCCCDASPRIKNNILTMTRRGLRLLLTIPRLKRRYTA